MKNLTLILILLLLPFKIIFSQNLKVFYLPPSEEIDVIKNYNLSLLKLALEKTKSTYGDYTIVSNIKSNYEQIDALKSLKDSDDLYIVPTMTDGIREKVFIPVRVPLYKGLFGIRMMMIHKDSQDILNKIKSIDELKKIKIAQGKGWPDTQILKSNGLQVLELENKSEMIDAIVSKKATAYPRSIAEIWQEIDDEPTKPLSTISTSYLYYPTAIYFFVQRTIKGKKLAERLEQGLMMAVEDGSFNKMFNQYLGDFIKKADLTSKNAIKLSNPALPDNTPVNNSKLWYIN